MNNGSNAVTPGSSEAVTVSFGECFQRSEQFDAIFKEGMALVERTAHYLDGEGRAAAKKLKPPVSLTYATESMRLTTRLLELASWLLIRRSLKQGEISADEAQRKRTRIRLNTPTRVSHVKHFDELPDGLRGLIEESVQLNERIIQLDRAMSADTQLPEAAVSNPVANQLAMLQSAFTR